MDQRPTNFYSIALEVLIQAVSLILGLASSVVLSAYILQFITAFQKYGIDVLNPNFTPPIKPEFFIMDYSNFLNSLLTYVVILFIPMTFLFFIPIHFISKKTLPQFPQKNAHKHMLITASILAALIFLLKVLYSFV